MVLPNGPHNADREGPKEPDARKPPRAPAIDSRREALKSPGSQPTNQSQRHGSPLLRTQPDPRTILAGAERDGPSHQGEGDKATHRRVRLEAGTDALAESLTRTTDCSPTPHAVAASPSRDLTRPITPPMNRSNPIARLPMDTCDVSSETDLSFHTPPTRPSSRIDTDQFYTPPSRPRSRAEISPRSEAKESGVGLRRITAASSASLKHNDKDVVANIASSSCTEPVSSFRPFSQNSRLPFGSAPHNFHLPDSPSWRAPGWPKEQLSGDHRQPRRPSSPAWLNPLDELCDSAIRNK